MGANEFGAVGKRPPTRWKASLIFRRQDPNFSREAHHTPQGQLPCLRANRLQTKASLGSHTGQSSCPGESPNTPAPGGARTGPAHRPARRGCPRAPSHTRCRPSPAQPRKRESEPPSSAPEPFGVSAFSGVTLYQPIDQPQWTPHLKINHQLSHLHPCSSSTHHQQLLPSALRPGKFFFFF